jgi:hypothetical protein
MKISDLKDSPSIKESQFYKQYGANSLFIGTDNRMAGGVLQSSSGFHKYRQNERIPRDTFIVHHALANYLSEKKFGVKVRQGVFSTRSSYHAELFGEKVYRFIPNDGYEMFYNPDVEDFTVHSLTRSELSNNTIQKHARVIESELRFIMRMIFNRTYPTKGYIKFLRDNYQGIDYDTFNVSDFSKKYFEKLFEEHDMTDEYLKKQFYNKLDQLWMDYYKDIKYYIDGLKKVSDLNEVRPEVEIITFPYNGFWLI